MHLIKRYPNRKLYDTEASRYVRLADIAKLVQSGEEIQVLDTATCDDLTESTLAQVITMQARLRSNSLPLHMLSRLIGASEMPSHEWLEQLSSTVDGLEQDGDLTADGAFRLRRMLDQMQLIWLKPRVLEQRVSRVLDYLSLPHKSDLDKLHSQLDALYDRLDIAGEQLDSPV